MSATPETTRTLELLHESRLTPKQYLILILGMLASMIEGFDIVVISYTAPAISADWGVPAAEMGLVFSSGVLGMTLGAMFLSWLADRYGRRIMVSLTLLISGVATCAVVFASNAVELVILRAIAGLALGVLVASLAPLIGEFSPLRHRILIVSILVAAASAGAMLGGLLTAAYISSIGWQGIFLYAGLITVVLGVLIQWLVPESIAFVMKRDPQRALAKVNRTLQYIGQRTVAELPALSIAASQESASVKSLLVTHRRWPTLLTWSAFFTGFVVVYFISSWMPQVLSNAGLSQERAIQGTTAIPFGSLFGTMLIGWMTRWLGLNQLVAINFALGTLCIFAMAVLVNDIGTLPFELVWSMLFIIGITLMGAFSNLYNVVLVIYPAQIRSTGLGWAAGLGRAGAVISPVLAGLLIGLEVSMPMLFVCFALPALAAALCVLATPMRELS
ncbi:MFS transporter [Pseudomaricurvus sp. HS19]|uniref:MFS transporter n=1 Tax=Pseudomaricurvus sp. HS19 TaxID=2692626 RepID=UPI00136CD251|nr:MFS transporter [Pseudomaricurvus sp. HS19]MYM62919.1 MFS transporter [Pseudomaricurvus sp. HS19]